MNRQHRGSCIELLNRLGIRPQSVSLTLREEQRSNSSCDTLKLRSGVDSHLRAYNQLIPGLVLLVGLLTSSPARSQSVSQHKDNQPRHQCSVANGCPYTHPVIFFVPAPPVIYLVPSPMRMDLPQDPPVEVPRKTPRALPDDRVRAGRYLKLGDNLFRAGNLNAAVERFKQAEQAARRSPLPLLRLAQVAFLKNEYSNAANRLREAITVEGGWLPTTPNIVALYGEPATFHDGMSRLESYLQANPTDRDAWLVLGVQFYLNGQTQKAGDIFLRLSDRKNDPVLTALLQVTQTDLPPPDAQRGPRSQ